MPFIRPLSCPCTLEWPRSPTVPDVCTVGLYHWRLEGPSQVPILLWPTIAKAASWKNHVTSCPKFLWNVKECVECAPVGVRWVPRVYVFVSNGWREDGVWPCFAALTLQKLKVSDEPVEAKEDYTKFNTKDLKTGKVCVSRCPGALHRPNGFTFPMMPALLTRLTLFTRKNDWLAFRTS